LMKHASNSYVK